jgi:hypothetical protein
MSFDPDAYLAKKSGFNPDAYLASKAPPPSLMDALQATPAVLNANLQPELVGLGRGFVDVGEGVKQLGFSALTGLGITQKQAAEDFTRNALRERQYYESTPYGQSAAGRLGRVVANIAPYTVVPGWYRC